jgi:hypothetical protein
VSELERALEDHNFQIALYVAGCLVDLENADLLERSPNRIADVTAKAVAAYDQLRASGFRPTREEAEVCLAALGKATGEYFDPKVALLIASWDQIKANMEKNSG